MDQRKPGAPGAILQLSTAKFTLLLVLFLLAAFPDVIFGSRTFFYRDFGLFGYPLAFHHRASFLQGEIPLWNEFNNSGMPFAAQWNTMVFYPLSIFYVLLPLSWSLPIFCLFHLLLGGAGMYKLASHWSKHHLGAGVAGLLYCFSGLMLSCLKWPNNMAALGWMPWVVLLAERGWREGGKWLVLAAFAGAMQMLSGGPEIILFTWMITGILWLFDTGQIFASRRRSDIRPAGDEFPSAANRPLIGHLWRFSVLVLLIAALSAVQLLPFFELLMNSQRGDMFADSSWPMPWWGAANLIVPLFRTFPSHHGLFVQPDQYWIASYYLGPTALALCMVALLKGGQQKRNWVLATISVLCLWLAVGESGWLYSWVRSWAPGFQILRFPIKFVVPVLFCLPLLAGAGIAELLPVRTDTANATTSRSNVRFLFWTALALAVAVICILAFALWRPFPTDQWNVLVQNSTFRLAFLGAAVGIIWFLIRRRAVSVGVNVSANSTSKLEGAMAVLLISVLWLDLLTHAPRLNPTVEPWVYEPGLPKAELKWDPVPIAGTSRAMVSAWADYRLNHLALTNAVDDFLYSRFAQFANVNLLDRVPKVDGFFSLAINEEGRVRHLLYRSTNSELPGLERFLGVSQKTAPGELIEWTVRTNFLPFATAGQQPVFLDGPATLRAMSDPGFRPEEIFFLDPGIEVETKAKRRVDASVQVTEFSAHHIRLEIDAVEPAWVVLAQAAYPPWRAILEGRDVPIRKANHAFQAVEVPAGHSTLELVYADRWFRTGAVLSSVTLAGCLIALWRSRRPHRAAF